VSVRRGAAFAAGLVLVAGLLAGCAAKPGVAAVADDRTITTAELAETGRALTTLLGGSPPAAQLLQDLVYVPVIISTAEEAGMKVSDAEAVAWLTGEFGQPAVEAAEDPGVLAMARLSVILERLEATPDQVLVAMINRAVEGVDVTVNPRFGVFDPALPAIMDPEVPDWIYVPAWDSGPLGYVPF